MVRAVVEGICRLVVMGGIWKDNGNVMSGNIKITSKNWYQYFIFTIFVVPKNWYNMAREILYKKQEVISKHIDGNEGKKILDHFEKTGQLPPVRNEKSENLSEWLKSRPLINISALCRNAGINRSNFDKSLKMGLISPKHEIKLIEILKHYGYGK